MGVVTFLLVSWWGSQVSTLIVSKLFFLHRTEIALLRVQACYCDQYARKLGRPVVTFLLVSWWGSQVSTLIVSKLFFLRRTETGTCERLFLLTSLATSLWCRFGLFSIHACCSA